VHIEKEVNGLTLLSIFGRVGAALPVLDLCLTLSLLSVYDHFLPHFLIKYPVAIAKFSSYNQIPWIFWCFYPLKVGCKEPNGFCVKFRYLGYLAVCSCFYPLKVSYKCPNGFFGATRHLGYSGDRACFYPLKVGYKCPNGFYGATMNSGYFLFLFFIL
jgi:hypothetical protein